MCVLLTHIFKYIDIPDVTISYGIFLDFTAFLGIFIHNWRAFVFEVLYHHQTFTDYEPDST